MRMDNKRKIDWDKIDWDKTPIVHIDGWMVMNLGFTCSTEFYEQHIKQNRSQDSEQDD